MYSILNTPRDVYNLLLSEAYVAFKCQADGQLQQTIEGIEAEIMQFLPQIGSRASTEPLFPAVRSNIEPHIGTLVELGFNIKALLKR